MSPYAWLLLAVLLFVTAVLLSVVACAALIMRITWRRWKDEVPYRRTLR